MSAQILVVKPKSLTAADKKLLRSAGVVCVEAADPSQVKLIQPEGPSLGGDELFYAAITALASNDATSGSRKVFTETLLRMMDQHMRETGPEG